MKRILLVWLALFVLGIAACGSSPAPSGKGDQGYGDLDLNFDLATEVPSYADHYQIVGLDDAGNVVYGPIYLPKQEMVMLTNVPREVARVQVTFMLGTTPVGTVSAPVSFAQGSPNIDFGQMPTTPAETLEMLAIQPASATIAAGGVQTFSASGRFSDGATYDLTASVTWSTDHPTVAEVDRQGRALGISPGTSMITASLGEVSSLPATLTVTASAEPNQQPTVASLDPTSGASTGGTVVRITGTNLLGATAVSFGDTPAASFRVDSATQITATTPARAAGRVHVRVGTPSGSSALTSAAEFTFFQLPVVTGLTPRMGAQAGGESVIITGSAFTGATGVTFGGMPARSFSVDGDTQITAVAPAGAGTVDVRVSTSNGVSPEAAAARYVYLPPPTLATLDVGNGPASGGNPVVLTGSYLMHATEVRFGGSLASFTVDSDTQITAIAPAGSGVIQVTVRTLGGESAGLDYAYLPIPSLTSIQPSGGPEAGGGEVSLLGTDLASATQVMFGTIPAASFEVVSDTQIMAVAPAGSGAVRVTVVTPGGNSNSVEYVYAAPPSIASVAPTTGSELGGNPVTITGSGLSGTTSVVFGLASASAFTVLSDTQLIALPPAGKGAVPVTVMATGGVSNAVTYTYAPIPALLNLVPSTGPELGGSLVTLLGTGLTDATQVSFGSIPASSFSVFSDTQISAVAPAGSGTVDVTVTTSLGTSNGFPYTYLSVPTLTSLEPESGPEVGGNPVMLNGTGFVGVQSVSFGTDDEVPFTVLSPTQIKAIAPIGSGAVPVRVTTSGGVTDALTYTYTPGPALIALAPLSGPRGRQHGGPHGPRVRRRERCRIRRPARAVVRRDLGERDRGDRAPGQRDRGGERAGRRSAQQRPVVQLPAAARAARRRAGDGSGGGRQRGDAHRPAPVGRDPGPLRGDSGELVHGELRHGDRRGGGARRRRGRRHRHDGGGHQRGRRLHVRGERVGHAGERQSVERDGRGRRDGDAGRLRLQRRHRRELRRGTRDVVQRGV